MRILTRDELQTLLSPHDSPCISIFLPTHKYLPDSEQDPIRFKNLLKEAERLLSDKYSGKDLNDQLSELSSMATPEFWRERTRGMAVFHAPGFTRTYRLTRPLPELVVVADSFHVKPIIRFLQSNKRFYLLSLSQKSVSLYVGSPASLKIADLSGLPASLKDVLGIDERREPAAGALGVGSGRSPVYHGRGTSEINKKEELAAYFRAIDQALWQVLKDEKAPLFLAGPSYYFPIYREISRYPNVAPVGIEGAFDGTSPDELHSRAWPIVSSHLETVDDAAIDEYHRLRDRKLASEILTEVAQAAVHGRVRKLFLSEQKRLFGRIDPVTGEVLLHGPQQNGPEDDDVLDDLAEAVLKRAGEVFLIEKDRMPRDSAAAAIFRW
ncbi:MAG: hypothetical protein IT186_27220 [Acidobacteria bacterium]|nr:hypothetical protein [Acidobacteriota bacterium]